jgi:phage terminase small subunit
MRQRGRKSAASFERLVIDARFNRLQPPDGLDPSIEQRFANIVASCDPQHFVPSDVSLLVQFCEADLLCDRAAAEIRRGGAVLADGRVSPWITVQEKGVRAIVALATKLRLAPSARLDPKTVARRTERWTPDRLRNPLWFDGEGDAA